MAILRDLPSRNPDTTVVTTPSRTGPYLEAYTLGLGAGNYWLGDEGSFFVATNATVGTGIAGHAAPVVADADTKPLLHLYNSGTKNIIPVFLYLHFTAIGAGGTLSYNVAYIDNAGATARTGGGTAITPVNVKSDASDISNATIYFGTVTSVMTTSRKVFNAACREVIQVIQDHIHVFFGSPSGGMISGVTLAGTATANMPRSFGVQDV